MSKTVQTAISPYYYLTNSNVDFKRISAEDEPIITSKSPGSATHSNAAL